MGRVGSRGKPHLRFAMASSKLPPLPAKLPPDGEKEERDEG